jgi:hypothetical protein
MIRDYRVILSNKTFLFSLQGKTVKHNQTFQNEALKRKARILEIRKPRAQSHLSNEKTGIYNHLNIKFKDDIYEV